MEEDDDLPLIQNSKPILNQNYRELVLDCFNRAHSDMALRIVVRAGQHRKDIKRWVASSTEEINANFRDVLTDFLKTVMQNIDSTETIHKLCTDYGISHVPMRKIGFKPDFFAGLADAIISEFVFLGTEVVSQYPANCYRAWTRLIGFMFTSVRDGYYVELRRVRKQKALIGNYVRPSISFESSSSSAYNEDSGIHSHETSFATLHQLPAPSPSPVSAPRKSSAPVLGRQKSISTNFMFLRGGNRANQRAELARKAYSGTRSQTAITHASSSDYLDNKRTGFYRTTHNSHDLTVPPKPPVRGRFQKNASTDSESKWRRFEELSRRSTAQTAMARHRSTSTSSIFYPNSVIDRFMNDQL
ncbi:unnamed protein product, partial [Mesorhabditis spiculigera]